MLSHRDARQLALAAFHEQFQREATTPEAQCLQAIAGLETSYASGWHGPGVGSFNEGAIQKGGWTGAVFTYTDTHPNADGTNTPYSISFRKYPNAVAGFQDLCKVVYVLFATRKEALAAAGRGDLLAFSTALHKYPCYYEGFGSTDTERIAHHHNAVLAQIKLQCAELGEQLPETLPLPVIAPALFIGCVGPAVARWQEDVLHFKGDDIDSKFGGKTQVSTRIWQTMHGLPPSGVVCVPELVKAGLMPDPSLPSLSGASA